uniref:NACHT domain-containing protein n=1 Tax=Heliothis virescens TaxID=7102 RepID=A0A2A4JRS3_HELVI
MQNYYNDSEFEKKLLNNSLLFSSIRKDKSIQDKIKKIKKYLDRGADINAIDANFRNNTPLHVAVMKLEPEIVSYLLEQGAKVTNKNVDNLTALDIAITLSKSTDKGHAIVNLLETYQNNLKQSSSSQQHTKSSVTEQSQQNSVKSKNDQKVTKNSIPNENPLGITDSIADAPNIVADNIKSQNQCQIVKKVDKEQNKKPAENKPKLSKEPKNKKGNKTFLYTKRTGTSGLSGQLYETKLLSLILFRALYVQDVNKFVMATNVEGMGAFDDIVFRYYSNNNNNKPKIFFIQAKHRDNPAKDKFTVEEIMKSNGDFSLNKYLESYIKISQMFDPENIDDMFKGEFKNIDCEFVIYTSAFENFTKMKAVQQTQSKYFVNTKEGKVFQFDYEDQDIESLVQTIAKSRAVLLAKRLARFIFKDNFSNMMMDDLIKTYHVFLAQHILEVELKDFEVESQNNFYCAKFRPILFTSSDELLLAFKTTIYKELTLAKKTISSETTDDIDSILQGMSFKVPVTFGNLKFSFSGSEKKKEKKLEYLCSLFKKLFEKAFDVTNSMLKIDDSMVGPNEMLQSTDLESYRLGGLVGNLFILDSDTKSLKLNTDINMLSEDNLKLLEKIKSEILVGKDLSVLRLNISVHNFPRLSLVHDEHDKNLIKEFLSKLLFYTNQTMEDEVETILKKEIDKYFIGSIPRQSDPLFRVKSDAIFLKVHDRVQKWWKQPVKAPYLTNSCEYFIQAEQDVLNSPLLSILNFNYIKTIKNTVFEIKFQDTALELLHINDFFNGTQRILCLITEESALTSMKLIQYFKEHNINDYTFVDLDYVGNRNFFVDVKSEINESKLNTLVVVCNSEDVIADVYILIKLFKGRTIIISNRDLGCQINVKPAEDIITRIDSQTGFKDLADTMRDMLLEERYILFQGKKVKLGILFKEETYNLINSNVLYNIINNEEIAISVPFNTPSYDEISDFYINEKVCRYITLDPRALETDELNIVKYCELESNFEPDTRDIILITENEAEFVEFIDTYVNSNVHWFSDKEGLVWQKSHGSLLNIQKYVIRGSHALLTYEPVTLKDLKEEVVIISAEPGMGKSSLLTHLAINTKEKYCDLWISKINLLNYIDEFKQIKENNVNIDLLEAVKFLFRVIRFNKTTKDDIDILIDNVSVQGDDISLNKDEKELNVRDMGSKLLEVHFFINCFNNNRVVLLFDGFDEICPDFAIEFMQLANILKKSKVAHLWITSRLYNVLNQLENSIETFSFTIQPLSYDNQKKFLNKIWSKRLGPDKLDYFPFNTSWGIEKAVVGFLAVLSEVLCDPERKFMSMPLHLFMISEIYQDTFHSFPLNPEGIQSFITRQDTMNKVNLYYIYERFVDVKFFKIRFGEKKPLLCINDPDMRQMIDNERNSFFYIHKIIAAHVIFGKANDVSLLGYLLDDKDTIKIRDFVKRLQQGEEKTGIIEQMVQDQPKFVHYTFAEYFATELICDKLKSFHFGDSLWKHLTDSFFLSDQGGPRRFFNAKLGHQPFLFDQVYRVELNDMFEEMLLERKTWATLIYKAIDEYLENIALFLLHCIKAIVTVENLNHFISIVCNKTTESCIMCVAAKRSSIKFISFVIELIKDIDNERLIELFNCSDLPLHNAMLIAFGGVRDTMPNLQLLYVLLKPLSISATVQMFCIQFEKKWFNRIKSMQFIHVISPWLGHESFKCFENSLDKLNEEQLLEIFTARNSEKKLPAHVAASDQVFRFFDKLEQYVDRKHFIEICTTKDRSGLTPLHYFKYTVKDGEKINELLDKVYGESYDAKIVLKFIKDNK